MEDFTDILGCTTTAEGYLDGEDWKTKDGLAEKLRQISGRGDEDHAWDDFALQIMREATISRVFRLDTSEFSHIMGRFEEDIADSDDFALFVNIYEASDEVLSKYFRELK